MRGAGHARGPLRVTRGVGAPHTGPDGGLCEGSGRPGPSCADRRRGRSRASARHDRRAHPSAGPRRADREPRAEGDGLAALDRADARRRARRDAVDRPLRRGERRAARRCDRCARRRRRRATARGLPLRPNAERARPPRPGLGLTAVRVGIVGGGQLGRMLLQAGQELGIACTTLDPAADSPAAQIGPSIVAPYDDAEALGLLADASDVVTYEFENVPIDAIRKLTDRVPVLPPPASLETGQDRLAEKTLFTEVGLPVPVFGAVDDLGSLRRAVDTVGVPAVLKTRRLGYDGKGQAVIRSVELLEEAWRAVGEVPSICEAFVPFDREVSIVAVRSHDGEVRCWPLAENHHRDGILRISYAPAPEARALQAVAEGHVRAVLDRLDHVGVLAIELFVQGETLLGNELAPRVHNSGHWTIEAAETSQFENHLRAICGLPLGDVAAKGYAAMVNLIGTEPDPTVVLAVPGAHLHRYGKAPRPRRKVGHVTLRADDESTVRERAVQISELIPDS